MLELNNKKLTKYKLKLDQIKPSHTFHLTLRNKFIFPRLKE